MGTIGHLAIVGQPGDVIGAGSLRPDIKLRKSNLYLPPIITRNVPFASTANPHATPNVSAWTNGDLESLNLAYIELVERADQPRYTDVLVDTPSTPEPFNVTWATEPLNDTTAEIHEAITRNNQLEAITDARFDDGESRKRTPPKATLYAQTRSEWYGTRGKLKELKTGRHSLRTKILSSENELMSRKPTGY